MLSSFWLFFGIKHSAFYLSRKWFFHSKISCPFTLWLWSYCNAYFVMLVIKNYFVVLQGFVEWEIISYCCLMVADCFLFICIVCACIDYVLLFTKFLVLFTIYNMTTCPICRCYKAKHENKMSIFMIKMCLLGLVLCTVCAQFTVVINAL